MAKNVYLVWLEWPEKCFRVDAQALSYLKTIVPRGSEVIRAKTRTGFMRALPRATHVITWYFKSEWFDRAIALKVLATPSAGQELLPTVAPRGIKIHFGGFHGQIMAESVIAFALAWCRGFFAARNYSETSGVVPRTWLSDKCSSIAGTKAVIVGYGKVGRAIGEAFEKFGCTVEGFSRKNIESLPQAAADCDWFVMALPSTTGTDDFLNAKLIAALPRKCVIVNVGRGNSIDEVALIKALKGRRLAGAYLDVAKVEPLANLRTFIGAKKDDMPDNLILMPHSAAFTPDYVKMCFRELKDEGLI